jgi:hypothetical protein
LAQNALASAHHEAADRHLVLLDYERLWFVDDGGALAPTFAYPVARRDRAGERRCEEGLQKLRHWVA